MVRRVLVPLAAAAALGLPAGPAAAQVTIDPAAPPSKEYEIPLEGARRDGAGGHERLGRPQQGERSAPLFGEGVGEAPPATATPAAAPSRRAGRRRPAGRRPKPQRDRRTLGEQRSALREDGAAPPAPVGPGRPRVAQADAPAGGAGPVLTVGAVTLSVLLLGGVLGSIARRRPGSG